MPTTDELDTRLTDLEDLVSKHTISRQQIDALVSMRAADIAEAIVKADNANVVIANFRNTVNDLSKKYKIIFDGLGILQDVEGEIDGANREYLTPNAYQPGTLIVVVDNRVYYGDTYLTETPEYDDSGTTKGHFELTFTPQVGQVVKALFYVKKDA